MPNKFDSAIEQREAIHSSALAPCSAKCMKGRSNIHILTAVDKKIHTLVEKHMFRKEDGALSLQSSTLYEAPKEISVLTSSLYGGAKILEIIASDDQYAIGRIQGARNFILIHHMDVPGALMHNYLSCAAATKDIPKIHILVNPLFAKQSSDLFNKEEAQECFTRVAGLISASKNEIQSDTERENARIRLNTDFIVPTSHVKAILSHSFYTSLNNAICDFQSIDCTHSKQSISALMHKLKEALAVYNSGVSALVYDYLIRSLDGWHIESNADLASKMRGQLLALYFHCKDDTSMTVNTHEWLAQNVQLCAEKQLITRECLVNNFAAHDPNTLALRIIKNNQIVEKSIKDLNIVAIPVMPRYPEGLEEVARSVKYWRGE